MRIKPAAVLRPVLNVWSAFSELGVQAVICGTSREVHEGVLFSSISSLGNMVTVGKAFAKFA